MPDLKEQIDHSRIPKHIAVIMDGNGRWAKSQNMARLFGHRNAIQSVREITETCAKLQVKYLTLYTFSTENWNRPQDEVSGLMSLLFNTVESELTTLTKNNVRLLCIGELSALPEKTRIAMSNAIDNTKHNTGLNLILALNYSGKAELIRAFNQILDKSKQGLINSPIGEKEIIDHLYTKDIPDPELLIRTSGEHRLSNFLIWQSAYTEFYFTEVLWPEFREQHLYKAIIDYQSRERRFGMTTEQILKS